MRASYSGDDDDMYVLLEEDDDRTYFIRMKNDDVQEITPSRAQNIMARGYWDEPVAEDVLARARLLIEEFKEE